MNECTVWMNRMNLSTPFNPSSSLQQGYPVMTYKLRSGRFFFSRSGHCYIVLLSTVLQIEW
jgi:hypothetical protein